MYTSIRKEDYFPKEKLTMFLHYDTTHEVLSRTSQKLWNDVGIISGLCWRDFSAVGLNLATIEPHGFVESVSYIRESVKYYI